jgi:uncharacterized delta-60 repeat protein
LFVLMCKRGGGLDRTFSGDGIYMLQIGDDTWVRDATLDSRDRLTIVGQSRTGSGDWRAMVVRLTARGVLDAGFSGNGTATFDFASGNDIGRAAYDRGSGVIVAEQAAGASSSDILLFALTAKGKLDTTFSGDGKARIDILTQDNPADITTDANGRIYVATTYTWPQTEASVLRTKANGGVDTSFAGGIGITHAGVKSFAGNITMWKGKPTVVGYADLTTDIDALVARFQA